MVARRPVAQMTTMVNPFKDAEAFNQPLAWDTSSVTAFTDMVTAPPLAPPRASTRRARIRLRSPPRAHVARNFSF